MDFKTEVEDVLQDHFEIRNVLFRCETIKEVVQTALKILVKRLNSQVASVFLFSKDGYLERISLRGTDKNGVPIDDAWYQNEKYLVGKGLTGRTIISETGSNFVEPRWSYSIEQNDQFEDQSRIEYIQKLGGLYSAIAIPLSGQHRTYGVLEVINKTDDKGQPLPVPFSTEDVYWLSIIGMNTAAVISGLRRQNEWRMLADISQMLVEPFTEYAQQSIYDRIARKLVGPLTYYKASVVRIARDNGELEVVARQSETNVSWKEWSDEPIKKGERVAGKVYKSKRPRIIELMAPDESDVLNKEWIQKNDLKSYACFPLLVKSSSMNQIAVGTLSVFTGFEHKFYGSDITLLENIALLIAAFKELDAMRDEVEEIEDERLSYAREVVHDRSVQKVLHKHKHDLTRIIGELRRTESGGQRKQDQIQKGLIGYIETLLREIDREFEMSAYIPVNINDVAQMVIDKSFKRDPRYRDISFLQKYDFELPDILAIENEIKEIFYNLISNAIRAIRMAGRKRGEIAITTGITEVDRIDYIRIIVKDNGVGIRKEDFEQIYDRNFSTFEGGTGMGLYITSDIVSNYGGRIHFDSTVGKGTEFFVQIPMRNRV